MKYFNRFVKFFVDRNDENAIKFSVDDQEQRNSSPVYMAKKKRVR
jgi:hypothetical protein